MFNHPVEEEKINWNVKQTKNYQFRVEIRRSQVDKLFRSTRKEQVRWLKSLKFLDDVKSDKDNFNTPKRIQELIQGLQQGYNNANFYYTINQMGLETYLCDMIRNPQLNFSEKNEILDALIQLTYFCPPSLSVIQDRELIELFLKSTTVLRVECNEDRLYLQKMVTLILNLSSTFDPTFNYFLMEFDFTKDVFNAIQKITRIDRQLSNTLREKNLKLHMNLFNQCTDREKDFFLNHISIILNDYDYHISHIGLVFKCLEKLSKVGDFWEYVQNEGKLSQILRNIQELTDLMPSFSDQEFEDFLDFFRAFLLDFQCVGNQLFSILKIDFFMGRLYEFYKSDSQRNKERFLKGIEVLSRVLQDGITLQACFPTKNSLEDFMEMLMKIERCQHPKYGKYCIRVLRRMLLADFELVNFMKQIGLMDFIPEVLEQKYNETLIIECISFIQDIIKGWPDLKGGERSQTPIVEIFHAKGFIREIEDLQNREEKEIFSKAEEFMKWINEIPN